MADVLIKGIQAQTRRTQGHAREDGSRDCSNTGLSQDSQGLPATTKSWKRPGKILLESPGRESGPNTVIADFQTPELRKNKPLLC